MHHRQERRCVEKPERLVARPERGDFRPVVGLDHALRAPEAPRGEPESIVSIVRGREERPLRDVVATGDEGDARAASRRLGVLKAFDEKSLIFAEVMSEGVLEANDMFLRWWRRLFRGRQIERPVRGGEILPHLHRGDRESLGNLVEAGAAAVGRQQLLHPQPGHRQQIVESVFVFRAGEPADRRSAVTGPRGQITGEEPGVEAGQKGMLRRGRDRVGLSRRRHLAAGHTVMNPRPTFECLPVAKVVAKRLDRKAASGFAITVAAAAVHGKKRPAVIDEIRGGGAESHRPQERNHGGSKPRPPHPVHSSPASRPVPSENASTSKPIRCSIEV